MLGVGSGTVPTVRLQIVSVVSLHCLVALLMADPADTAAWEKKRAQLQTQIRAYVDTSTTPVSVATSLGLKWPMDPPGQSLEELREELRDALRRAAVGTFPMPDNAAVREQLRQKHPLVRVGDKVDFRVPELKGPDSHIQGIVTKITPNLIRVGNRWIRPGNLPEATAARFLPDRFEQLVQAELGRRTRLCKRQRESSVIDGLEAKLPEVYRQAGYRFADGAWHSVQSLVQKRTETARSQALAEVTNAVMTDNGFEQFRGEWMPQSLVAQTLRREQTEKEEQRREQERKRQIREARERMPVARTIREVEIDQSDYLDRPLIVSGTIDTSTHYGSGYMSARADHYSYTFVCRSSRTAHFYLDRQQGTRLNAIILDTRDGWKGRFIIEIKKERYREAVPNVYAELLEFAPPGVELEMVKRYKQILEGAEKPGQADAGDVGDRPVDTGTEPR